MGVGGILMVRGNIVDCFVAALLAMTGAALAMTGALFAMTDSREVL